MVQQASYGAKAAAGDRRHPLVAPAPVPHVWGVRRDPLPEQGIAQSRQTQLGEELDVAKARLVA